MTLSMRVFTLNCGNGSLGSSAAEEIVKKFAEDNADLFILNCQEVNFDSASRELQKVADSRELTVSVSQKMVTHTKLGTQFHNNTGMMTLILHPPDVNVRIDQSKQARRATNRFGGGYNKGGGLTRLVASKAGEEEVIIDNFNAHLDAFSDAARAQDWANLHRLQNYSVTDWKRLCAVTPDLTCSGYDANTRNKIAGEQTSAWENPIALDMQSLVMAPLGNVRESRESTYKNHLFDILQQADPKRKDRMRGGMLDLVAYINADKAKRQSQDLSMERPEPSHNLDLVERSDISIPPQAKEGRDHAVIGSSKIIVKKADKFDRVREAIACSLVSAAPQLASYLLSEDFEKSKGNKTYLLEVYKRYLSPEGLLQRHIQLHADQLHYLKQFQSKNTATSENATQAEETFTQQMFSNPQQPWLAMGSESFKTLEKLKQQADYQQSLLRLLDLRSKFLNEAVSEEECKAVCKLVNQVSTEMRTLPYVDQQKSIKQTKQLLSINKLVYSYDRHLQQELKDLEKEPGKQDVRLLRSKTSLITRFKHALVAVKKPGDVIEDLGGILKSDILKTVLGQHRQDDFFTRLYRKLRKLITGTDATRGEFFAAEAAKELKPEEESIPHPALPSSV